MSTRSQSDPAHWMAQAKSARRVAELYESYGLDLPASFARKRADHYDRQARALIKEKT